MKKNAFRVPVDKKRLMLSSFLSCMHQTYDKISACHINIISYPYSTLYRIISLSYQAHQLSCVPNET